MDAGGNPAATDKAPEVEAANVCSGTLFCLWWLVEGVGGDDNKGAYALLTVTTDGSDHVDGCLAQAFYAANMGRGAIV